MMPAQRKLSARQTEILLSFMENHKDLANCRAPQEGGPLGKRNINNWWDQLAKMLNSDGNGNTKSPKEWRIYWNNIKYKVRAKATLKKKHIDGTGGGHAWDQRDFTEEEWRILNILESEIGEMPVRIPFPTEACDLKPKKLRQDNFTIVKECCVNLVKKHGRSVTLFDDIAFRELIDLIPMTQSEKHILTSQYIQKLLDDDQLADQTDMETTDRTTDDIAADDNDETPLQVIKGEVEAILCTCGKDNDESMSRHTAECPASSQQTYWTFFEVSLDSATCQICNETITWTNISTLKQHLHNSHPSVDFIDEDEEFQKGPPSEDGSRNEFGMEEVYLDETVSESEQTASAAKRRRKRDKAALNITGPITRENIAASLQRFKSLDSFGQYVAELMKLIPKDKCIKFQILMVERLLQEQAAAG